MILLVSAVAEELGELEGETLGIGHVTAAARTAALIADRKPEGVILLGTGGSYNNTPAIGQACVARRVGLSAGVALMGLGYVPHAPPPLPCDLRLVARLGLPEADVQTVGAITTDPVLANRVSDGWDVEHTEAYGAALACTQAGVPFAAVIGITNHVGPEAHAQWLSHRNDARKAVLDAVGSAFGGAPASAGDG